ncbi:MAG TPA: DUF86 domain-containing protein [Acidiferrobacterales bacterium]
MKRDDAYVHHIHDAITRVLDYTREGRDAFMQSTLIQDAVIRNLEIVGEAAKGLSAEFRRRHPTIPWSSMTGMRDVLIHGYMGVDLDIVWDVVANRLLPVQQELQKLVGTRQS